MQVTLLNETGYSEALLGVSLSFNSELARMPNRAQILAPMDGGHNKFLESIATWWDITAPRYWWQQFDTYRVGITKQSESTMHTLLKYPITQEMFEAPIHPDILSILELARNAGDIDFLKNHLPEGWLQRRIVLVSYKGLRSIYKQRKSHRLKQWDIFCTSVTEQVAHPTFITE